MKVQRRYFDGRTGLQTTKPEQADDAMFYERFGNARASQGAITRRAGIKRVGRITPANGPYCGDFDGTNDSVAIPYDARVWNLASLYPFTLELLAQVDTLTSRRTLFAYNHATTPIVSIYQDSTSSGRVVCEIIDSALATLTLSVTGIAAGTLTAIQLVRTAARTFTLRVNGTSSSGTTTADTLVSNTNTVNVGRSNAGEFYDGTIDFVRLLSVARSDQRDGWTRLTNPYARYVLADYPIETDANSYILDRSPFGRHASIAGGLSTTTASLAVNPVPIQSIGFKASPDNERLVTVIAGGRQYEAVAT